MIRNVSVGVEERIERRWELVTVIFTVLGKMGLMR